MKCIVDKFLHYLGKNKKILNVYIAYNTMALSIGFID